MLELKHISKIYNPGLVTEMCLFDDFNFTVNDGEFVSVIGSNGSGKTSMLNIICGSIPVNAGEVLINGKCVNKKKISNAMPISAECTKIPQWAIARI